MKFRPYKNRPTQKAAKITKQNQTAIPKRATHKLLTPEKNTNPTLKTASTIEETTKT
jgi:hypothetical protein